MGFFSLAGESLLTKECEFESIPQIFVEGHDWVDFPKYSNRNFWNNISPELKQLLINNGREVAKELPVTLTGYDYLLFKQGESFDLISKKILSKISRLEDLILAELLEGKGTFINDISNSVWDLCALGSWSGPESQYIQTGHIGLPSHSEVVVDELTGEIAGILSWAYYFFENEFDKIDPQINSWIISQVRKNFLDPNSEKYDFYWMSYQKNDVSYQTPWVSYNWLLSSLLIEKDNLKRQKSIYKALECLDKFYKAVPQDGACSGGAEIWQYSVGKYFQSLELLDQVSVGEINIYDDELLKKMGEFICCTYINDDYVFNYSQCSPNFILPASLVYRFGDRLNSNIMKGYGSLLAKQLREKGMLTTGDLLNKINFLLDYDKMKDYVSSAPFILDSYMKESQIVIARSEAGSDKGFFFGLKGGHNNEYGNQNDAGNFVFYVDGHPLIIDPGKTSKSVVSIGADKYSVWSNQSAWHNLPTINGYMEASGENYRVIGMQYSSNASQVCVTMNLVYVYESGAGVKDWTRTFTFDRLNGLDINDKFSLENVSGDTFVSFMAYSEPKLKKPGIIEFSIEGQKYEFEYKSSEFTVDIKKVATNDEMINKWELGIYRIVLKPNSLSRSGNWTYKFRRG